MVCVLVCVYVRVCVCVSAHSQTIVQADSQDDLHFNALKGTAVLQYFKQTSKETKQRGKRFCCLMTFVYAPGV